MGVQTRAGNSSAAYRRKQHKKQKRQQKLFILAVVIIFLAIVYIIGSLFFMRHFLPHTVINGIHCSGKSIKQSTKLFEKKAAEYVLTLKERDDKEETISGSDINVEVSLGTSLDDIMAGQNGFTWISHLFGADEDTIETAVSYDDAKLNQVLEELVCMDESQMYDSEDAALSGYREGAGYELVKAVFGTRIAESEFRRQVEHAILNFDEELDLAAAGCYVEPVYTESSEAAVQMLDQANKFVNTTVTYEFGDKTEVIDGSLISQWIQVDENLDVSLNQEKEAEYISDLAKQYDTKWKSRTITSHSGDTVTVPAGGNYGWRVNQEETLTALNEYLTSGKDYTGEVVYYQTAAQYGEQDYGSTYIEVSISAQHMWFYKNGSVILESDFVSGDVAKGHDTPKGAYRIAYKARDQELVGQGYSSPVSYWMPFVDGCGFHDASWRDKFGGSIYLKNGSHGCLNMPVWAAKELYDSLEAGTAVLIY